MATVQANPGRRDDLGPPPERGGSGIERALDVLSLFARSDSPTLGVTEIAQALGLSKAVVHRTLTAFCKKGYGELDETTHRYRLGPQSMFLGLSYLEHLDVRAAAHEVLEDLVAETEATATLSMRVGWSRVYLDQVLPKQDVKMVVQLGKPFPLHTGASSKALLAFLPEAEREEYLSAHDLVQLTPHTITDVAQLRAELAQIQARGFAVSMGERDANAGSVAAPVFAHDGRLEAVISACGPVDSFRDKADEAAKVLVEKTTRLSERFGYRPPRPAL